MATQLGKKIRELRTAQNMLLRQLASKLEIDTSIISKMERGERRIKKEHVAILAEILKTNEGELMTLWLSDKVMEVVEDELYANQALKSVTQIIEKSNNGI